MTRKNNDLSDDIRDWSKKKIISEYKGYCQQIDDIGCFGTRDVIMKYGLEDEIDRRGYYIYTEVR